MHVLLVYLIVVIYLFHVCEPSKFNKTLGLELNPALREVRSLTRFTFTWVPGNTEEEVEPAQE